GFLITWILLTEIDATGTIDLPRFYGRRFLRLAPAYVTMLTAVLAGAVILHRPEVKQIPRVVPALVTYTYNYQIALGGTHFDILVAVWSLCVEEQFYLAWPWTLRRLGPRRAVWFCLAAIAALSVYRTLLYAWLNWGHLAHPSGESSIWIYFATDTRIAVILLGCLAALSLRHPRVRKVWQWMRESRRVPEVALLMTLVCVAFVTGGRPSSASIRSATVGYTLTAFTTAGLIAAVFSQPSSPVARALSWRPLVSLGRISYGVYLFHAPIAWSVHQAAPRVAESALAMPLITDLHAAQPSVSFALVAVIVLFLTSIVAGLHYHFVERWFMSFRGSVAGRTQLPG